MVTDFTSTIILRDLMTRLSAKYIKVFAVDKKRESLAEYVRRVREEKKLSLTDVERQSGAKITNGYVSRIENGYVLNVTPQKLAALAKGLGVPEDEVFAVARGKSLNTEEVFTGEFAVLFKGFHDLSPADQAEMMATVRMLAAEVERRRPRKQPTIVKGKK